MSYMAYATYGAYNLPSKGRGIYSAAPDCYHNIAAAPTNKETVTMIGKLGFRPSVLFDRLPLRKRGEGTPAENDGDAHELGKERRSEIRRQCRVVIEMLVRCTAGLTGDTTTSAIEVKGRLLDLTATGAQLQTRKEFDPGQELRLTMYLPDSVVHALATVRWCKALGGHKGYASGVQFPQLAKPATKAIEAFLKRLDKEGRAKPARDSG